MIIGVGVDVCDLARFEAAAHRTPGMPRRVLTPAEQDLPLASQAARFAAKEALAKALGAPSGLEWHDVEVEHDAQGRPVLTMRGTVARAAAEAGVRRAHLSLSHDAGIATAFVVLEGASEEAR